MTKLKVLFLYLLVFAALKLPAQVARLDGQFYEYSAYYISSIDIQTGASQAPLFRFRIFSDQYPLFLKIWFRASMLSPTLGLNDRAVIIEMESNSFKIKADIILDNRSFSAGSSFLYDQASPPNVVPMKITINEVFDASNAENMLSSVLTTGQLPDGEYTFELKLYSGPSENDLSLTDQDSKTIYVETPSGISLESPGGDVADILYNSVYTTYPVFNWFTTGCRNCETYIRVALFNSADHGTPEDALRDETVLPFDQVLGWERITDLSTYQYPISGAKPLEYGKIYVWQIKNVILTTAGKEDIASPINAFKVVNPGNVNPAMDRIDPLLQTLRSAIGDDQFNSIFGSESQLNGFTTTGTFLLNGNILDEQGIVTILNRIFNNEYSISNIMIRD